MATAGRIRDNGLVDGSGRLNGRGRAEAEAFAAKWPHPMASLEFHPKVKADVMGRLGVGRSGVADRHAVEDLNQDMMREAIRRIATYDPDNARGACLHSWMVWGFLKAASAFLARSGRRVGGRSWSDSLGGGAVDPVEPPPEHPFGDLHPLVERLDGKTRELLHAKYVEGRTMVQIGQELGVSKERVRQLTRRAREDLAASLGREIPTREREVSA